MRKKKARAPRRKLDGRRLSRRIEFTPRLTEYIRYRVEQAGDSPEVIGRSIGVAKATIQRLVRERGWVPAVRGPQDLSPAEALAQEARALARIAPAPGGSEDGDARVDIGADIERLLGLVSREIGVYENLRTTLKNEPQAQREALKTTHVIASLTSTLDELRRMRAAHTEPGHHDNDMPADIDAFRTELARRIAAFMESRPDDGVADEDPARGVDPLR